MGYVRRWILRSEIVVARRPSAVASSIRYCKTWNYVLVFFWLCTPASPCQYSILPLAPRVSHNIAQHIIQVGNYVRYPRYGDEHWVLWVSEFGDVLSLRFDEEDELDWLPLVLLSCMILLAREFVCLHKLPLLSNLLSTFFYFTTQSSYKEV